MKNILPPPTLTDAHRRTFADIFQLPDTSELAWCEVFALFSLIGDVVLEINGDLKIVRHGYIMRLPPPHVKCVTENADFLKLRHFLEISEFPLPESDLAAAHALVVINQHQARLFRTEMHDAIPLVILPHALDHTLPNPPDAREITNGQGKPSVTSFFEPVARALEHAAQILIFGTDNGNELEQFTTWLREHHPDLARRIAGTRKIDEKQLTESQLLTQAREFYSSPRYS